MDSNVLLFSTVYSGVNRPEESAVYDYGLDFYPEGIKTDKWFGATVSAFLSMKNLYDNQQVDVIASKTLFKFLTDKLTEADIVWMLNETYEELKKYPKAKEENIEDLLDRFPPVTPETAKINNDLLKWFYENCDQ